MTAGASTVSDFVKLSQAAIIAGDLDAAETYKKQAFALKSLTDEFTPRVDPSQRLDMGNGQTDAEDAQKSAQNAAIKAWYADSVGGKEIDKDIEVVLADMYGGNYRAVRYQKAADFTRWIRSGNYNPALKSLVVYTPEQIMLDLAGGMSVADLKAAQKATQVESQDTSGELTLAA